MPAGDGTGPQGRGPLTGRGLGPCGTTNSQTAIDRQNLNWGQRLLSGFINTFSTGRGSGMVRGRGLGRRGGQGRNR